MSIQRLSHLGICVTDLDRALHFYRDGLGFRVEGELKVEGPPNDTLLSLDETRLHAVYLVRDGVRIELLHFESPGAEPAPPPRPMNRPGLTHLSFRVTDLSAAVATAEACGGRLLAATRIEVPQAGVAAAFLVDPDGSRVELFQSPGDPTGPPLPGGASGARGGA